MPEYHLSDDCKLALVQARFEALHQPTAELGPGHLTLGALKTIPPETFGCLFPDPARFAALCRSLQAGTDPAPLNPADISYTPAARAAIAGGMRLAAGMAPAAEMGPLHLLLGLFLPVDPSTGIGMDPSEVARQLLEVGITPELLRILLAESLPSSS